MHAEKPHELWPFTSQEARDRYLAHYTTPPVAQPQLIADRILQFLDG